MATKEVVINLTVNAESISEPEIHKIAIEQLRKRIEEIENQKMADEAAASVYRVYAAFISQGFTKTQAFEMVMAQMKGMR